MFSGRPLFQGGNTPILNASFREQAVRANLSFAVLWLAGIYPCPGTTWESGSHPRFGIGWFSSLWLGGSTCFVRLLRVFVKD